ncbi:sterol desaturase family protein [Mucilaginibacter psychrotolerans]|uniref:Fatty acid hydroxylase family protein n=1 Tax=Mucilaginibacter psychrotolerans TaxID=1524096 RepID=A0A4Y8SMC4_9SPHI|nr:sterol desaturase family protein [Mucilaginibacter psychrotolerans]TFF39790.1 fatty acid hydroxylase family protein [Mucilaginibacter psychrotolerans]
MLRFLSAQSTLILWLIFLVENLLVTAIGLLAGWIILKLGKKPIRPASPTEILTCIGTNLINTAITYAGFWGWQHGYLIFGFDINWYIIVDFLLLFLAMDLAMYVLHYAIHQMALYKVIHRFHHHYRHPIPIDLFVLHPLETMSFGSLWLFTLALYHFNFYAVLIYLSLNVVFGIIGHLGVEPLPAKLRDSYLLKYLGTSSFHHNHHTDIKYNFGFYTSIWDRIFKTYKA